MSELRANLISNGAGTGPIAMTGQFAGKAFANVVTDAATAGDTFNQSSITDLGTGTSTHTFTNSYANTNYGHAGACRHIGDENRSQTQITTSDATGSCLINIATDNGTNSTIGYDILWWGDLA